MPTLDECHAIIERIKNSTHTSEDLAFLWDALLKGMMRIETGPRGVGINGDAPGAMIITGDNARIYGADVQTIITALRLEFGTLLERFLSEQRNIPSPAIPVPPAKIFTPKKLLFIFLGSVGVVALVMWILNVKEPPAILAKECEAKEWLAATQAGATLVIITPFANDKLLANTIISETKRLQLTDSSIPNVKIGSSKQTISATGDPQEEALARNLGEPCGASIMIWGSTEQASTSIRVLNLLSNSEPQTIFYGEESPPERPFHVFDIRNINEQVSFLALFAISQPLFTSQAYTQTRIIMERAFTITDPSQMSAQIDGLEAAYDQWGWSMFQVDSPKAIEIYTEGLNFSEGKPVSRTNLLYNRAYIAIHQGFWEDARLDLQVISATIAPEDPMYYKTLGQLGYVAIRLNDFRLARQYLDHAKLVSEQYKYPLYAAWFKNYGWVEWFDKHYAQSVVLETIALDQNDLNDIARVHALTIRARSFAGVKEGGLACRDHNRSQQVIPLSRRERAEGLDIDATERWELEDRGITC